MRQTNSWQLTTKDTKKRRRRTTSTTTKTTATATATTTMRQKQTIKTTNRNLGFDTYSKKDAIAWEAAFILELSIVQHQHQCVRSGRRSFLYQDRERAVHCFLAEDVFKLPDEYFLKANDLAEGIGTSVTWFSNAGAAGVPHWCSMRVLLPSNSMKTEYYEKIY